ncbi:hypothetical protein [Vreelandella zhaodongensis]|uniref:hypothetical protein n=1 Tax=Vreelandella zhaodongensis TaxID=1176240 RepID=UPI003EBF3568
MASQHKTTSAPLEEPVQIMQTWWQHYCLLSTVPMVRLQVAWLENVTQAMQMEADLFRAIVKSSEKMTQCLTDNNESCGATELTEHYQEMMQTLTEANMERFERVSQLSHEFRRSLWEEI